jgi:predicted RND superfamily exporter protein
VFGREDNLLLVHVEGAAPDGLFTADRLDYLTRLHAALAGVEGIVGVDDLTTAWVLRPGSPLPAPLLGPDVAPAEARRLATEHPLIRRQIVSEDGRAGLIVARIDPERMAFAQLQPVVHACLEQLSSTPRPAGIQTRFTGIPTARVLIAERLIADQLRFFPICSVLFLILLWLGFRDVRAVLVPMVAVGVATVYTAGLLGATGEPINIINNVLPVLIFVIAMSDAIHVISRYRRELAAGATQRQAIAGTVRHLAVACLLTSLTTAVGLGSLLVAEISILQAFGLYAAAGVGLAYIVTVVLVPLAFSYLSPTLGDGSRRIDALLDRISMRLGEFALRHRLKIIAAAAVVMTASVALGSQVRVDNNVYEAFSDDDPIVAANHAVERDFAGIVPVAVVVRWEEGADPITPGALRYVHEVQERLAAERILAVSIADLIAEWNAARHGGDPAQRRIPDTAAECRQGLMAIGALLHASGREALLTRMWAPDARMLRLPGRADDKGSRALNASFERVEAGLAADAARQQELGIRAHLGGDGPVASRGIDRLIWDMFSSLMLAFAIIFPVMCLLLRSLRAGLISMIPNVFPLLITLGMLGALGLDLRVTSVIVFTVSLGLAVDDTIHFMVRLSEEWRRGGVGPDAYQAAILRTFRGTGAAIVQTTILLGAGFAVLLTSSFPISRTFGVLLEVTVVGALVGDLLVLPAVLSLFAPRGASPTPTVAG